MITADDLEGVGSDVVTALLALATSDGWSSAPVPAMEWDARAVVDHLCNTLAFYANHAVLEAREKQPRIRCLGDRGLSDADLARSLTGWIAVLATILRAKSPSSRGWHTLGLADPAGFAALACNELLIHCDDVHRAHDQTFTPGEDISARLLRRLFPDVVNARDVPAGDLLRWANGRCALPDRPRRESWRSHPAPCA